MVVAMALVGSGAVDWMPDLAAQMAGVVSGTVADSSGRPVAGATVSMQTQDGFGREYRSTTDASGHYTQVGLPPDLYIVTVVLEGVAGQRLPVTIESGQRVTLDVEVTPAGLLSTLSDEEREAFEASVAAFEDGVTASENGRYDEAIAKFSAALEGRPRCLGCLYNLGVAYTQTQQYDDAERAFNRALELRSDSADAYDGLAGLYTAQGKRDEAAAASARAAELRGQSPAAARSAEEIYVDALAAWNAGNYDEAKAGLEATIASAPDHAEAHYWLGMARLNGGDTAGAASSLQRYLELDPAGRYADQVKAMLPNLNP